MTEWAREERNKVQQVNHVVDMQAMAYIPRLYDIMVKSIDEDRKTKNLSSYFYMWKILTHKKKKMLKKCPSLL